MAETRRLTDLPADRLRLLMARLRQKDQVAAPGIERVARDGAPLPLSFAQQRLWFLDRLEPGSPLYNMPAAVELRGRLYPAALAAALGEIARRHEALRTTFREEAGEPEQIVAEPARFPLPLIDLQGHPEEAALLGDAEARRPFDLGRGPLLRAALLRLDAGEHVLLVTMHHIVSDGWSTGVLVRELGALYAAAVMGAPSPLPELAVQYADFAVWQRRHLSGERLAAGLAWWRERLAGLPPALELPADHPRPARLSARGGAHEFAIPEEDLAGLDRLARSRGATLFMTLLAGFAALLGRYTGRDDLAVGTPVAGRDRRETEPLIGLLVNTLVLRLDVAGDPELSALLKRAREATLAAYAHQEVPFERLVEELAPERSSGRPPLAQVMLVLQNAPSSPLELPGLAIRSAPVETATAKLELTCTFTGTERGLAGRLEYSRDLFEGATIERLAGHLARLLAGAAAAPRLRLSELPLLSAAERAQLLAWNRAVPEARPEATLTALFAAQVARAPEAPAVTFAGETLSYCELDRRANRLARHLRRLGVGPEARVGMLLERSLEMVVALLGILKAGGAYVPLDPAVPEERLAFLCHDAGLQALVTDGRDGLPPVPAVVRLGAEAEEDGGPLEPLVRPDHLCYVIYTSGSTGRPKGVLVRHGSVARLLSATQAWFGCGPADVWTLFHSCSFDFSVWELWGALAYGGRLVVVPYWVSRSPEAFRRLLAEERVTVLNQTPSAFRQLVQADAEAGDSLALRLVIFGGEALDLAALRPWYERHAPDVPRLVNMYGITETTVHVSYRPLDAADLGSPRSPIGVAIPDLGLRLLGPRLELVPVGVPGEICVGGAGLARGYLGRPDLTAERFVPDPYAERPGERLYRSGDLARHRPDGGLDYLGRRDEQVKVRGFRVEPGEVEAALRALPQVRAAVVLPRRDPSGVALVAYLETARGAAAAGELRKLLRGRLPDYMVPAAWVFVEPMPRTVNGKLDRRALAALPLEPDEGEAAGAPRTPSEELVAGIFAEVLERERVGPAADFFALGGHSLLATRVASRVRAVLGVELPVRAVFEVPTVEALAARIEASRFADAMPPEPVVPISRQEPPPLSFAQRRLWFLDRFEPGSPLYNIPAAVALKGRLDPAALAAALGEVVRRHEALRTTFREVGGEPAQVIAEGAGFTLPLIDLQGRADAAGRLIAAEARRPFDLGRGPLLRAALLRLGAEEHVLLVTMHHIVGDGWSIGVLVRELGALYAAFGTGRPSPLPELAIQYADFAAWQRRRLSGGLLASELAWWRGELAGLPPALELPADHPRPAVPSGRGAVHGFALEGEDLGRLARRRGATRFMALLAGFAALLHRYTGADDLAVGTPVAGRTRLETEPLVGCFVNTLVLRADLSGDPDFGALLGRVRETALAAYVHQEVPFERLVEELVPERDLSRSPLFQVMAGWDENPAEPRLPGLRIERMPVPAETAKFDLSLELHPAGAGLLGSFEYSTDLFEAATVARLASHYAALLRAAAGSPDRRLSDLPLLSAGERRQLAVEWNGAPEAGAPEPAVDRLFAAQAARAPEAVALVLAGGTVTYGELDRETDRLARRLRALGVGPERTVGIHLPPSAATVAAVLAIWKAGGAYLPLDPAYPAERLAFLLEDSGAAAVITTGELAGALPAGRARVLALDADWDEAPGAAPAGALPEIPESLAYVLYTSGSTGRPKGVGVGHRALSRHLRNVLAAWELTAADRVLQLHSPSFDPWLEEAVAPLLAGAAVVVAGAGSWEPAGLLERAAALGVTVLNLPTVVWRQWVREPAADAAPEHRVRLATVGGEAMSGAAARLWWSSPLSRIRLLNAYGPTEAVITMELHEIGREAAERAGAAALGIGRPAAGRSAYVLDRWLGLLPAGAPGELHLGGPVLARGYLGRPEATAERFLPDPFAAEWGGPPGARLYRTGDLARRRPDGVLEFLGRVDRQIKVRGFRVEPEEIEEALARSPLVSRAVVLTRPGAGGEARLVAAVVPAPGAAPTAAALREHLGATLPAFMVPAAFVPLADLPLTPNRAKVDRRAVERLVDAASPLRAAAFQPPRTPVEELLAGVWSDLLAAPVGVEDDFFTLGGHSLLAVQLVSRLRDLVGIELPVRTVFERPTVAGLAEVLELRLRAALLMDAAGQGHEESSHG